MPNLVDELIEVLDEDQACFALDEDGTARGVLARGRNAGAGILAVREVDPYTRIAVNRRHNDVTCAAALAEVAAAEGAERNIRIVGGVSVAGKSAVAHALRALLLGIGPEEDHHLPWIPCGYCGGMLILIMIQAIETGILQMHKVFFRIEIKQQFR